MSMCPKYKGICQDESGMRFVHCCGDLTKCAANGGMSITVSEWVDLYRRYQEECHRCRPNTVRGNISCLNTFRSYTSLADSAKVSAITKEMILSFWNNAAENLEPATCKSIIDGLRSMCSEDFREWVGRQGKNLERLPTVKGLSGKYDRYESISASSKKKLGDLRFAYRNLEDPRKWMALTLGLCHGLSKADVLRMKWSAFNECGDAILLTYNRIKTGKIARWGVTDEDWREWCRVRPIMQTTTKFCARWNIKGTEESLFRLPDADKNKTLSSTVIDEINADLRAAIPEWKNDSKAFHNLRKEFATYVCLTYDWDTAEQATGDTIEILRKSYISKKKMDWKVMKGVVL